MKLVILLTATLLLTSAAASQAACYNNSLPRGSVIATTDPRLFQLVGRDRDSKQGLPLFRVFYRAGKQSRNVYYATDSFVRFPAGQSYIYVQDLDSCRWPVKWVFVRLMVVK